MYFPLEDESTPLIEPYQEKINAREKQEFFLQSFPPSVDIFIARWEKSHIRDNIFRAQFQKQWNIWIPFSQSIEADLVLWFQIPKEVNRIFNSLKSLTIDKTMIEDIFPQYTLKSTICKNYQDIQKYFSKSITELKVLKPQNGTRRKGIFIEKNIPNEAYFKKDYFPYLLQDFFDTSWWFYEFPGMHDFRIVMLNGEIIWKFLRQPEAWKYTANSFKKWWFIDLEDWKIPREIQKIIEVVEYYCAQRYKHRYYSIDFGRGKNGEIKIFEMNSAPGLTNERLSGKLADYICKNILKVS